MRTLTFFLCLVAGTATASDIDLVTLPSRDSVQLTIYNSEDLTLVKERRQVTFKRGLNQLQFSWKNTLIDPTSVEFRPLAHADEIEVADTVFPGRKPQHLVWNIESGFEGQVPVEVSYFTSGMTWTMDYVALTNADETTMDFSGHVRVYNRSGEDYENAEIRLIVGRINLVEKISELARRQGIPVPQPRSAGYKELRKRAGKVAFGRAEAARDADRVASEKKQIVKEGLSEYFMFTIAGTETVPNGWSKRMQAVEAREAAFSILYRMRAHQYGPRPVRFFLWRNSEAHGLGDAPLPDGRVRIFRRQGGDSMSFLGEQRVRYVPIKARIEINLGADDLVVYRSRRQSTERFNFRHAGRDQRVAGWDEKTRWLDTIRNYRDKPIRFELRRVWPGDVDYSSETTTRLFDHRTIETTLSVAARGRVRYPAVLVTRQGRNKRQDRVQLR